MIRTTELINQTGNLAAIATNKVPGHSLLKWNIDTKLVVLDATVDTCSSGHLSDKSEGRVKFELTKVPEIVLNNK